MGASSHLSPRPYSALSKGSRVMAGTTLNKDDILELKTGCRLEAQNGLNVLHYIVTDVVGVSITDAALLDLILNVVAPKFKAYMPATATFSGASLQVIDPPPMAGLTTSVIGAGPGTQVADALPPVASMLFTKRTALAGRAFRGRMYLPFWSEASSDANGDPLVAALALGKAIADVLLAPTLWDDGANGVYLTPVIWHRTTKSYTEVTTYLARTKWATQRRRSQINRGDAPFPG